MNLNLTNRTAVVCGSSQGIGQAAAMELAELGATCVLMARNEASLQSVCNELPTSAGQQHSFLVADFLDASQVSETIGNWVNAGNTAQILVNNTGGPPAGTAIDADAEEYRIAFNAHLICNQYLTHALVPGMKAAQYGRIINVISTSVKQPIPGLGVSNTIRGAVASWAKTLATELGPDGITVNNVLPGMTWTGRLQKLIDGRAEAFETTTDDIIQQMKAEIPAQRFGEAAEIGAAVAYLATPAAAYINGINLPVDGGRTTCL